MTTTSLTATEVVERLFRLRRDGAPVEQILALFVPDIEATALADGAAFHSREDVRAYLEREEASQAKAEVSCTRCVQRGDRVLAEGRLRTVSPHGLTDSPAVWVFGVRDGRICEIAPFASRREACASFHEFAS